MLELRQSGESVKSLAETFKRRRINEHQHSIQEKQKKLDKIKTLLKLLETDKIDENNLAQLTDFVYGAKPLIKPKISTNQVHGCQSQVSILPASNFLQVQYKQAVPTSNIVLQTSKVQMNRSPRSKNTMPKMVQVVSPQNKLQPSSIQLIPIPDLNLKRSMPQDGTGPIWPYFDLIWPHLKIGRRGSNSSKSDDNRAVLLTVDNKDQEGKVLPQSCF